jgi:hypothetical protein
MELILIVGGLLLMDLVAMRFGDDSRIRDDRDEAHGPRLASLAEVRRTSLRIRLADGLRALAVRIEPAPC